MQNLALVVLIVESVIATVVLTAAVVRFVRRRVTRTRFDHLVARFEHDLASPPWPPMPHEYGADERIHVATNGRARRPGFARHDSTRAPLAPRPNGIESFRIEGCIDVEVVRAEWDGRWVTVSRTLSEHVAVAIAVDRAFAAPWDPPERDDVSPAPTAEEYMLAALACCDVVDVAEFEVRGQRVAADDFRRRSC
jgi:hypothetical protein